MEMEKNMSKIEVEINKTYPYKKSKFTETNVDTSSVVLGDSISVKDLLQRQESNKEMVSHPDHYDVGDKTYEPYKVIASWDLNFNIGNAVKYLSRYKKKWNPIEDLNKAKQYIDFEIERLLLEKKTED